MLIYAIGLLVVLYARYYLSPKDPAPRFFALLLAFMGAMGGIVLSGNLVMLVVFWELTSVFSFLLIGFWHQSAAARDGARMALIVTAFGGLCLLAGVLLIGRIVGSYDLDRVLAAGDAIRAHRLYVPVLVLVLLGAFTKSAQFPFHFWLPNAMTAPTPVSAYLHSATMVKAGVFLLIRLSPALSGTEAWFFTVAGAGLATLVLGAFFALFQHDLKGLLAYSTISHLGLITALIGIDTPLAYVAAIFHIVNHAVFKASLFMAAGIVDHETGTRDMRKLSGLRHAMPITATLAIVASAAMAGVPLLNGFLSKEMFFAEAAEYHDGSLLDRSMPWIALVASILAVAYSLRFIHAVFFGPLATDLPKQPHEPPFLMRLPVEILVIVCLLVGIFPALTIGPYLRTAAASVLGASLPDYSLTVWHGINFPLVMSAIALVGGVALYFLLTGRIAAGPEGPPFIRALKGQRIFERLLVNVSWIWARRAFRLLGTERLQTQLRILVLVAFAAAAWMLWGADRLQPRTPPSYDPLFALLWLTGGRLRRRRRLAGEVPPLRRPRPRRRHRRRHLPVLRLALRPRPRRHPAPRRGGDHRPPPPRPALAAEAPRGDPRRRAPRRPRAAARRDLVIAIACGLGVAGIAYAVMTSPLDRGAADWFLAQRLRRGRRHQRRQRHPRRLPRLRHLRRDHRPRHRRAHRLRPPPPLPPGRGERRPPRAAARPGPPRRRGRGAQPRRHRPRLPRGARR